MIYLKEHIISVFDKNRWVLNTNDGKHILINNKTRELIGIIKNSTDLVTATNQFNEKYNQTISQEEFRYLIINKFADSGVLVDYEGINKKKYMSFTIPLLSSKVAGYFSEPFKFLFKPSVFWSSLIVYVSLLTFLSLKFFHFDFNSMRLFDLINFSILFYTSMLVHELGHIAACKYFRVKHGEIGFGFYLIFPVVYAQITNVWSLKKHYRIIANLGGVYLELFYASMISFVFLYSNNYILLYVSLLIFIKAISELNPFIRYDGYWILSDLTNTPNLLSKSSEAIMMFFSKRKDYDQSIKKGFYWILLYGFMNFIIVGFYMGIVLANYWNDILTFPKTIISVIKNLFLGSSESIISLFSFRYLLIVGFYILLLKLILFLFYKISVSKYLKEKLSLNGVC